MRFYWAHGAEWAGNISAATRRLYQVASNGGGTAYSVPGATTDTASFTPAEWRTLVTTEYEAAAGAAFAEYGLP